MSNNDNGLFQNDLVRVLYDQNTIKQKVSELASIISHDLAGEQVLVVSVLKGSYIFCADLVRSMTIPISIDFMVCSSYGSGTTSSGEVRLNMDLSLDPEGKTILIVEDIVDSGRTLLSLKGLLAARKTKAIYTVALLDKPSRRQVDFKVDYAGFTIPDEFIVGYGLDYAEKYRQLPYIAVLKPEVYS